MMALVLVSARRVGCVTNRVKAGEWTSSIDARFNLPVSAYLLADF